MSAEVEDTFKRLMNYKGVKGLIILNSDGVAIKTTMTNEDTVQYAGLIHDLFIKSRSTVKEINPNDQLESIRIRSFKHEILIAPAADYMLICVQEPDANSV